MEKNEQISMIGLDLDKEIIMEQRRAKRKKVIVRCPRCGFEHEMMEERNEDRNIHNEQTRERGVQE